MSDTLENAKKTGRRRYEYFMIGTGTSVPISDFVHVHMGLWYVADRHDGQYYGPVRGRQGERFSCSTLIQLARAGGYRYEKHTRAVARAMSEFGIERRIFP